MSKKFIIVGGVAGGASAAARLRRLNEKAEIIMFERDEYISFANCGLPYHIGETIKKRENLLVQTPASMRSRFNIDVRNNSEVIKVDLKEKKVTVKSLNLGIYEESYDCLILSPGAKPIRPNISGINSNKIVTLRNIPDTDKIKSYVDKNNTTRVVVIGGGFIGVEMAENLVDRGVKVTLVEATEHILPPFDSDMAIYAEKKLRQKGVDLVLNDGVVAFNENDKDIEVVLNSENALRADLVILAIGVTPDTKFLIDSGINLGRKGHIIVNDRLQTNVENIYAVGDAIEVVDFVTKQSTAIPLAGPANKQGRIAADNAAGIPSTYNGTQGTSIIKVFDLIAACTGANEKTLNRIGMPYEVINIHPQSHAGYYPGGLDMTIKLIFNKKGKILGAQIMGYDGVDKRIDVISTAMRFNGTVKDLTELELAYAPPYSSAKDPVNMAGFVAENVITEKMDVITVDDLENTDEYSILLDVRTTEEYKKGHIDGALNIPVDDLRERMKELDKRKKILVYCQVGLRGYIATRILLQNGYKVKNLTGGYKSFATL